MPNPASMCDSAHKARAVFVATRLKARDFCAALSDGYILPHRTFPRVRILNSAANRDAIFTAALDELEREAALVVFEDMHWADEATLDLLKYLGRSTRGGYRHGYRSPCAMPWLRAQAFPYSTRNR
jgi:hypothetical protein